MAALSSLLLAFAGFAATCLSMQRHYREGLGRAIGRGNALALRIAGWVLLASSIWPVLSRGGSIGLVLWFGLLSAAALILVWIFSWLPRVAIVLAISALALAILIQLLAIIVPCPFPR